MHRFNSNTHAGSAPSGSGDRRSIPGRAIRPKNPPPPELQASRYVGLRLVNDLLAHRDFPGHAGLLWSDYREALRAQVRLLTRPSPKQGRSIGTMTNDLAFAVERDTRGRSRLASAAAAASGAVIAGTLVTADGGFFPGSWRAATLCFCALAGIGLLIPERVTVHTGELGLVAALAALAAWIGLSALWSDDRGTSFLELERAVVYPLGVGALVLLAGRRLIPAVLIGIVAAVVAVAAYSVIADHEQASLQGPVGYANALGILCAMGLLLTLGFVLERRGLRLRALALVVAIPLVAALVATGSRGAAVALVATIPSRRTAIAVALLLAAAVVTAVAIRGVDIGDRPYYWRAALEQFTEAPLGGTGAGTFARHWPEHRPRDPGVLDTPDVLDAHSLYLESLAELGPAGLALVLLAFGLPLALRRRDALSAAVLPAYLAYLVHAGLDWDWEMPAVTLFGLACGVALVAGSGRRIRVAGVARLAVLLALVAAATIEAVR